MKKLLFFAVLCCMAFASKAQVNSIINRTNCPVQVSQVCYLPPQCMKVVNWTIVVPPGGIIPMPMPACPAPQETSYLVCWVNPPCPAPNCVAIAGQVSPPAPPPVCIGFLPLVAPMQPCPACGPANAIYDPVMGNVRIQ